MTASPRDGRHPSRRPLVAGAAMVIAVLSAGCSDQATPTPPTRSLLPAAAGTTPAPARTSLAATPTPSRTSSRTSSPTSTPTSPTPTRTATVAGIDVSAYQPHVEWAAQRRGGVRFVWIKASEGTTWRSPHHATQRAGARAAGLFTGSYHYARPLGATGAAQARAFLAAGGGWTADGRTLPGALDLEKNTGDAAGGDPCYGLSPARMRAWIRSFTTTYRTLTGRDALIYVRADWWNRCTGSDTTLAASNPLWLYDHEGVAGPLPAGWTRATVWQSGVRGGLDRNTFFGTEAQLRAWAAGS